jgi:hypothetical protein
VGSFSPILVEGDVLLLAGVVVHDGLPGCTQTHLLNLFIASRKVAFCEEGCKNQALVHELISSNAGWKRRRTDI